MGRIRALAAGLTVASLIVVLAFASGGAGTGRAIAAASTSDPYCTGDYSGAAPVTSAQPLRFGVDPGMAGSMGGAQLPTTADDLAKDVAYSAQLRPPGRVLVVRLNRLFWSGGDALISQFQSLVAQYAKAGLEVELQVRYHPASGEDGDLQAWQAYVRHVVDVFGPDPAVVAMTITNEVNVTFSPNTSDGSYTDAQDALIQGIEAAHNEAMARGYRQLRFGFTYAYRFSPASDASFFSYLGSHGGDALRQALGFVGLDFYPGSVYPPTMGPTDTYRSDTAQALGVVRDCFMPMAGLGSTVPIWITENGIPTGASTSEAQQAAGLSEIVNAVRDYSATFNVTDYRWFNLRDASSSDVAGSLPGAATTFVTDGLLRDDYSPKPAFAAYRALIAADGQPSPPPAAPRACRPGHTHRQAAPRTPADSAGRHLPRASAYRSCVGPPPADGPGLGTGSRWFHGARCAHTYQWQADRLSPALPLDPLSRRGRRIAAAEPRRLAPQSGSRSNPGRRTSVKPSRAAAH